MNQFFLSPLLLSGSDASMSKHLQQQDFISSFLDGDVPVADFLDYLEAGGTDIDAYLSEVNPVIEKIVNGGLGIEIV